MGHISPVKLALYLMLLVVLVFKFCQARAEDRYQCSWCERTYYRSRVPGGWLSTGLCDYCVRLAKSGPHPAPDPDSE